MYCSTTTKSTNIVIINTTSLWSYDGSSGGDCVIGAYPQPHSTGDSGDGGWMICAHPPPHSTTTMVALRNNMSQHQHNKSKKHQPIKTKKGRKKTKQMKCVSI